MPWQRGSKPANQGAIASVNNFLSSLRASRPRKAASTGDFQGSGDEEDADPQVEQGGSNR